MLIYLCKKAKGKIVKRLGIGKKLVDFYRKPPIIHSNSTIYRKESLALLSLIGK